MKIIHHLQLVLPIVIAGLLSSVSTAHAGPDGKITRRAFHYNNYKFWRAGAINAPRIGSYGKKKSSTGIDIQDTLPASAFKGAVKESGVYGINFSSLKKWKVNIDNFQYADVKGSGSVGQARKKNAQLKLVYLTIDNGPMIRALNGNRRAKDFMKRKSSRVVGSIWVVVSAKVAQTITTAGNIKVGYTGSGMKLTASGGGSGRTTSVVDVPRGAIFAYMLDKAKWKKKGLKKKSIRALEDDQVGLR